MVGFFFSSHLASGYLVSGRVLQKSYSLVPFATLFVALFHPFDTLMGYDMDDR
jgi:hypothetical protein